tara:strand:+ start:75 stop:1016 length:942 start_codon:yes stop_codon:yes gene_type:complete
LASKYGKLGLLVNVLIQLNTNSLYNIYGNYRLSICFNFVLGRNIEGQKQKCKEKKDMAAGRFQSHSSARPKNNSAEIWIYGHHAVMAALKNADRKTKRILLSKDGHLDQAQYAQNTEIKLEMVSPHQLEALLPPRAVHQGIAALVSKLPAVNIEQICNEAKTRQRGVIIVLDQITDPRNIGSIIRSGAFFGALAVIIQDRHSPTLNGIIAKAASGGMEKVPVIRVKNISRSLEKLKLGGFWCLGLDSNSTRALSDYVPNNLTAIVLGAEGSGLRRLVKQSCDELTKIEGHGPISSLNVSNACAIALFSLTKTI